MVDNMTTRTSTRLQLGLLVLALLAVLPASAHAFAVTMRPAAGQSAPGTQYQINNTPLVLAAAYNGPHIKILEVKGVFT